MLFAFRTSGVLVAALAFTLAGCSRQGELVLEQGVGITAVLSACPSVGIPDYTGNLTTFRSSDDTTQGGLDLVAAMTRLRHTCNESGEQVYSEASFDVHASRTDARGSRVVRLPYFVTVVRGGTAVVSKRVGEVTLTFADGQERASASGRAGAFITRAEAVLPEDIRKKITRRRRAGQEEAALDPLADPEVKAAIARTRFEVLLGFQLTEDQLAYNVRR